MDIKPFDKFWFNCLINNIASILCSFEPSYRYLMFSNDYSYDSSYIGEQNEKKYNANFIRLNFFVNNPITNNGFDFIIDKKFKFINKIRFLKVEKRNYNDKKEFLEEIKYLLKNRQIIAVLVDLFYWNKKGVLWNKEHRWHYTLLNGYNKDQNEYYAIEDDAYQNYGKIAETEDALISSVKSDCLKNGEWADYLIHYLPNTIPKYNLPISEIASNIKNIIKSIKNIEYNQLFKYEDDKDSIRNYFWMQPYYLFQIVNRQKANIELLKRFYEKKCVDSNCVEKSLLEMKEIINLWKEIRAIVIKVGILEIEAFNKKYYEKVHILIKKAFNKEINVWKLIEKKINLMNFESQEIDLAAE